MVPIPAAQGLVILSFATIEAALDRLGEIVATGPAAVEMLDRMILELAARNPELERAPELRRGPPGRRPGRAVLRRLGRGAGRPRRRPGAAVRGAPARAGGPQEPVDGRQGRLLEGPQGRLLAPDGDGRRRQADRLRRGHGGRPRTPPRLLRPLPRDRRAPRRRGRLLRPRRRRLPAHPADPQREDARGGRHACGRSRARSRTWSSSSAAR